MCRFEAVGDLVAAERLVDGAVSGVGPLGQFVVFDDPEQPLDVVQLRAVRRQVGEVDAERVATRGRSGRSDRGA
jgi:hypothetical protein